MPNPMLRRQRSPGPRFQESDADPGPLPIYRRYNPTPPRFPSDRVIRLEENLETRWRELVAQVRGSGDRDAWMALSRFHVELRAWLTR